MGVDICVLNFLAATHVIHKCSLGRTLTLGRQGFHVTTPVPALGRAVGRLCRWRRDRILGRPGNFRRYRPRNARPFRSTPSLRLPDGWSTSILLTKRP
jgi:hypothetical protein